MGLSDFCFLRQEFARRVKRKISSFRLLFIEGLSNGGLNEQAEVALFRLLKFRPLRIHLPVCVASQSFNTNQHSLSHLASKSESQVASPSHLVARLSSLLRQRHHSRTAILVEFLDKPRKRAVRVCDEIVRFALLGYAALTHDHHVVAHSHVL